MSKETEKWRGATWRSNLLVGGVLLVAGLTKTLTLAGTDSSEALAAVGAGLMLWGGLRWLYLQKKKPQGPQPPQLATPVPPEDQDATSSPSP